MELLYCSKHVKFILYQVLSHNRTGLKFRLLKHDKYVYQARNHYP